MGTGRMILQLLLVSTATQAMQYMLSVPGREGLSLNHFLETNITFYRAKESCLSPGCLGFGCFHVSSGTKNMICYVLSRDWYAVAGQATRRCDDCVLYKKPKSCAMRLCSSAETCVALEETIFVDGEERVYQCCPYMYCGRNCVTSNFNHSYNVLSRSPVVYSLPIVNAGLEACARTCIRTNCTAMNFVQIPSRERTECFLYTKDHIEYPLMPNHNKDRINNYYLRNKLCE